MPSLSIVIPTLGRTEVIHDVISGLAAQEPPLRAVEVLVVNDVEGSNRELNRLEQFGRAFPLRILTSSRPGASAARNTGWRAATAPLILFLDDDVVPSKRLVAEHMAWHGFHPAPEVGVLGSMRWSPRAKVTPFMRWLEMGIQFDYGAIKGVEAGWERFYTCNASVKRAMLELVGGFDEEDFPFGYEDLEVAKRMNRRGFRVLYNPRAVGKHVKTETLDGWRRNLRRIAIAEHRFTSRYPEERPYFYERFRAAADAPPARGRSARLAWFVPPGLPLLGPFVWRSFDLVCSQRLAPEFLSAWEAATRAPGPARTNPAVESNQ